MIHDIRSSKADGAITVIQLHEMADFGKSEYIAKLEKMNHALSVDKNQKERKQKTWIF